MSVMVSETDEDGAANDSIETQRDKASQPPHVYVFGDLSVLRIIRWHEKLPDQIDPAMGAYRRLRGVVERGLASCNDIQQR